MKLEDLKGKKVAVSFENELQFYAITPLLTKYKGCASCVYVFDKDKVMTIDSDGHLHYDFSENLVSKEHDIVPASKFLSGVDTLRPVVEDAKWLLRLSKHVSDRMDGLREIMAEMGLVPNAVLMAQIIEHYEIAIKLTQEVTDSTYPPIGNNKK